MNVSQLLLKILEKEGIKHIFGIAGDALNPLTNAINNQNAIQWVKVKHEGNASYAAFAQGELGSNFGVCASTVGPGALHLINGLYNAKKERSPVVAITGQVPVTQLGTNYHQEADLSNIFDDICAYQAIIRTPDEAPRIIYRAIKTAINYNAVCRIELPADVAGMKLTDDIIINSVVRSESSVVPSKESIDKAIKLIDQSRDIGILAGAGCRDARDEVLELSNKLNAPITHTIRSADIFDHSIENVVGLSGLIGNPSGYKAVMNCDLLLMLGTDFPYTEFLPEHTQTIQVDIRPENIGNRMAVTLGLHGDILSTVTLLSRYCAQKQDDTFLNVLKTSFKEWKNKQIKEASPTNDIEPLHPQIFANAVSDLAADDAIFVVDTGTSSIWATNIMDFHSGRRIIGSFNHGSMAVGLPAAIGAQLLYPDREVWAIMGDGAFNMCMQDLSTAAEYNLPIKILVFNNSELGFVKIEMEEAGLAPNLDALEVKNFNFSQYAELCGGMGKKVEHAENVVQTVEQAKQANKPFIIDAIVNSGELSLPPKIGIKEATNFGTSKIKELVKAVNGDKKQWENIKNEVNAYFDRKS